MLKKLLKFIFSLDKRKLILISNWLYWIFKAVSEFFNAAEEMMKTFGRYKEDVEKDQSNKRSKNSEK